MSALTGSATTLPSFEKTPLGFSWNFPNVDLRIEQGIDVGEAKITIIARSLFIKTGVRISAKEIEFEAVEGIRSEGDIFCSIYTSYASIEKIDKIGNPHGLFVSNSYRARPEIEELRN